jgi:hypothetical protein
VRPGYWPRQDRDVDPIADKVGQFPRRRQPYINVAVLAPEPEQPRHQPFAGERIERADRQDARGILSHGRSRRRGEAIKGLANLGSVRGAYRREADRAGRPDEQGHGQVIFQVTHRPAHGAMGDVQLFCCLGETQVTGRRLELASAFNGGRRRAMEDLYVIFTHI